MSDLSLALIAGAVALALIAWSWVSQARWRRGSEAGTCPAFLTMPDDQHKPCIRDRGHAGYHRWTGFKVGS